jgi:DNA-binding XRE family transcriptional regulator
MPTIEQNQQALLLLLDILKWFKEADAEKLKRSDLGPLSFDVFSDTVSRTLGLYRSLLDCDLSNVSYAKLSEITSAGNAAKSILENIREFDVNQQNPSGERHAIIQRLRDQWEVDFAAVTPVLAYATKSSADFQRLEREARGALIDLNGSKITFQEQTSGIIGQMNTALGQVQDAAKKAGVSKHTVHFKEEANTAKLVALAWLSVAVFLAVVIVLYVMFHVEPTLATLDNPTAIELVKESLPRLLVVFVLSFGMIWAAKNVSASTHNFVVNRHRQNALASFETFVEGASGKEVKDAVLIQATSAIFSPQDTGYAKGELPHPVSQVFEVLKSSAKG